MLTNYLETAADISRHCCWTDLCKTDNNNSSTNTVTSMYAAQCRSEHITPVLEDLHWLPVGQRIVFKTALTVWKSVHGVTPAYLSDLCVPADAISGRQHLRSAATGSALYWFHAPGLQLDNEVSQSTDQPHGTVCHQHYGHRTCWKARSSGHWRRTCSRLPRRHWDVFMILAPDINIQTYLLTAEVLWMSRHQNSEKQ